MKEYHISECCNGKIFFRGEGKGFWCSVCGNEVTRTIVGFTEKEINNLKRIEVEGDFNSTKYVN